MTAVARTQVAGRQLDLHWRTRSIAAVILGASAIGIWWPLFGSGVLWSVPMLVWSVLISSRVVAPAGRWQSWLVGGSWLLWVPIAGLLVGLPASVLDPTAARETARQLVEGMRLAAGGSADPWGLSAWLAFVGLCWVRGAANSTKPGNGPAAWAFVYFAAPFIVAMLFGRAEDAAWHGAALLAAALLWATAGGLRAALPAVAVVAVIATIFGSQGPTERRVQFHGERVSSGEVDWSLSLGPDQQPHAGAVFFDISSDAPALWRAQVLDHFDGRTWQAGVRDPSDDLPQPTAQPSTATVTIRKFRDVRVVGAGRVISVAGQPAQRVALGESMQFGAPPETGSQYTVISQVVRASAADLASVQIPDSGAFPDQTHLWDSLPDGMSTPMAHHLSSVSPELAQTPFGETVKIAHDLAQGTTSQLEVVRRVQDFLLDPRRFRYSRTNVPGAGRNPLLTFLTRTHVGYCQHFAGGAAVLLRMAGIPTRVVVGFATGKQTGSRTYRVTDADAHAWIEVYFEGYGWVPFNPTPSAADAQVANGIDPLQDEKKSNGPAAKGSRTIGLVLLGVFALGIALVLVRRLRQRRRGAGERLAELLVRLAPGPTRPSTTVAAVLPELVQLGPSVAALAEPAQRERFDPAGSSVDRPRGLVWRALRQDVGFWRAARLMVLGPPRRDQGHGVTGAGDGAPGATAAAAHLGESASVAPPGGHGPA